jgi:UDP-GlcNAc:undecaprenyl-phosphate GlcNAc-1-phosphate transferase
MEHERMIWQYIVAFVAGVVLAAYGTPVARKAALQFGILDRPDGKLKDHHEPVPYLGGLAIYVAFLLSVAITFEFTRSLLGLLLAGGIVVILGLLDDLGALEPPVKLVGQVVVALVLIKSGVVMQLTFVPVWAAMILTIGWLVVVSNSFNIIDIMDGLASSVAMVAALFLFVVAILNGRPMIATVTAALAGSLLGFLPYNLAPARIYMGDTGSLFVGMMIGALAMIGSYTRVSVVGFLAPVIILGIPLFDVLLVTALRYKKGQSPLQGSPDHFSLRLRRWGLSVGGTVAVAVAASVFLGGIAIAIMYLPEMWGLVCVGGLMVIALGAARFLRSIDMG